MVVGLTGGIGSGKSAVANFFAKRGVPIIDADCIARELVEPGQAALAQITQAFGADVLDSAGQLDRAALRKTIFSDATKRRQLEAILHPRIRATLKDRINQFQARYCIIVVPLLLETGQQDLVDRILVVDAAPETQRQRAQQRDGVSEAEIQAILRTQLPRAQRLDQADDIISNDASLDDLDNQVKILHERYLTLTSADM